DAVVRVLSPEDELRMLCLHMLRHSCWRPIWLCDVAAAIEGRSHDFDWDLCLAGTRRDANWVSCSIGLARQLLACRADDAPVRVFNMPRWLEPAVLKQWGSPAKGDFTEGGPLLSYLRYP